MRSICRNLLESANSQKEMERPLSEDDDGLRDFDPDSDTDKHIDDVKCSYQDENEDFEG